MNSARCALFCCSPEIAGAPLCAAPLTELYGLMPLKRSSKSKPGSIGDGVEVRPSSIPGQQQRVFKN